MEPIEKQEIRDFVLHQFGRDVQFIIKGPTEQMTIKFLGIEVERKTDILAFAAFVISIGGLAAQAVNLIKGPDVFVENPRQVLFKSHRYPDGQEYLRISANLVYINKGSPGYDDITKEEKASVAVGNKVIDLVGQEYIDSSYKDGKLIVTKLSDANPIQIKSGSVVSHETYFSPWPNESKITADNFTKFSEFIDLLKDNNFISVEIKVSTYNGNNIEASCKLNTSEFLQHLEAKKWSAPVCITQS